jgi:hypothetical protein
VCSGHAAKKRLKLRRKPLKFNHEMPLAFELNFFLSAVRGLTRPTLIAVVRAPVISPANGRVLPALKNSCRAGLEAAGGFCFGEAGE